MKRNFVDSISDNLTIWNGGFYSNKNDSRIMVPKASPGVGWNVNIGNPKTVVLFILSIVIIASVVVLFTLKFGIS